MYQEYQADPQVQDGDQVQDPDRPLSLDRLCSKKEGDAPEVWQKDPLTHHSDETDSEDNEPYQLPAPSIQHQWFIDTFSSACSEKGVEADLDISLNLAAVLDEWITKRLGKKSYIGNRCFYEEKPHHIKEKIHEIVSEWESLRTSGLGKTIGVPPVPDLKFLIINREAIFGWINEQRQRSLDKILSQFEATEQETLSGYAH